jgi:hypothetical protein
VQSACRLAVTSPSRSDGAGRGATLDTERSRLSDVARDTIEGRILTGFQFRTADVQGAWIGKKVAQWVDKNFFEPVD